MTTPHDPARDPAGDPVGLGKPEYAPRPAWVRWLVIVAVVLLAVVVVALVVGGEHGPGRHISQSTGSGAKAGAGASPVAGLLAVPAAAAR